VDGQTQVPEIKRRRSQAEIEQLVAEYEASGLGRTAFCQQRGLSLSTLARYRRRQEETTGAAGEGKRWLAVEVSGGIAAAGDERASGLTVVLPGGRRIEVGRGFDADTLQRLLAVVERG
jgi:transposase